MRTRNRDDMGKADDLDLMIQRRREEIGTFTYDNSLQKASRFVFEAHSRKRLVNPFAVPHAFMGKEPENRRVERLNIADATVRNDTLTLQTHFRIRLRVRKRNASLELLAK